MPHQIRELDDELINGRTGLRIQALKVVLASALCIHRVFKTRHARSIADRLDTPT